MWCLARAWQPWYSALPEEGAEKGKSAVWGREFGRLLRNPIGYIAYIGLCTLNSRQWGLPYHINRKKPSLTATHEFGV